MSEADKSSIEQTSPRRRRKRRSSEEVLDCILRAASDEFEINGYAGTTTANIAKKAGVAEALIFSNFGSKAQLFQASIFKPLKKHLIDFSLEFSNQPIQSEEERDARSRQYIVDLENFLDKHKRKFISLFFAQTYGGAEDNLNDIEGVEEFLSVAASMAGHLGTEEPRVEPRILSRLSFAAIFSTVIFRDWIFPKGSAGKDQIFSSLTDFVLDGLNVNLKR